MIKYYLFLVLIYKINFDDFLTVGSVLGLWYSYTLSFSFALPPCFLCFETSTFIGCGFLMVLAALYGVLAIGKK